MNGSGTPSLHEYSKEPDDGEDQPCLPRERPELREAALEKREPGDRDIEKATEDRRDYKDATARLPGPFDTRGVVIGDSEDGGEADDDHREPAAHGPDRAEEIEEAFDPRPCKECRPETRTKDGEREDHEV